MSCRSILRSLVVVEEVVVPAFRHHFGKLGEFSAFALGGSAEAFAPVYEARDFHYVKQVELAAGGDVLHVFGHEFGTETVLGHGFDQKGIGHGRFAHADLIAGLDEPGGLDRIAVHEHAAFLAGVGGDGAGLEYTHGP